MDESKRAALAAAAGRLAAVEEALERLEAGSYGRCGACGRQLSPDELAADPVRALCPSCLAGGRVGDG